MVFYFSGEKLENQKLFEKFIVAFFIAALFLIGISLTAKVPEENFPAMFYFFDVGQGDAELIKIGKDKEILIDGGPDSKVVNEIDKVLSPFDHEIEAIIISHMHADHIAGLNYVLDRKKIGKIYLFDPNYDSPDAETLVQKIKEKNIPVEKIEKGKELSLYGLSAKLLWPPDGYVSENLNNTSAGFSANFESCRLLFMGDLPAKIQESINENFSKINVLKVAHHGSKDGTSNKLIEKLAPDFAVIEVGKDNKFGHPAPSTLEKLKSSRIVRTDQSGTIRFGCDGQNTLLLP